MYQFRLLITAFDPFGGESVNPAWEAVRRLPKSIGGMTLCKLQIPTVFGEAARQVLEAAREYSPHVILCIGQAGGRSAITPERIAVNICDARICDNQGNQPKGEFIDATGPAAYFSTVDVSVMAAAVEKTGIPSAVSNSAGTFVCNDTLYRLLHHYAGTDIRVGFIHVPYLPSQAKEGVPSMPLESIVRGLCAAIASLEN